MRESVGSATAPPARWRNVRRGSFMDPPFDVEDDAYRLAMFAQFDTRCSAVRQPRACAVSVGLWAPLVPITEAPRIPRFGTSWEKPQRSTTLVSRLSPILVPP